MKWLVIAVIILAQQPAKTPESKGTTESNKAQSASNPKSTEDRQGPSAQPLPASAQSPVGTEGQRGGTAASDHTKTNSQQTSDEDRATQRKLTWFTGVLACVGVLQLIVMFLTWLVYRRQAGIMDQQRTTMESQWTTMQGQLAQMETSGKQTTELIKLAGDQVEALTQAAEIAVTQTRATVNLVEAAQKSADAAKTSADIAAGVAVPKLVVHEFTSENVGGVASLPAMLQFPKINLVVTNYGQTPALLKWWSLIFSCEELPDDPVYSGQLGCGIVLTKEVIQPNQIYTLTVVHHWNRQELSLDDVQAIIDHRKTLNAYGYVCYGDIFGNPLRRFKFFETALNMGGTWINWRSELAPNAYVGTDQLPPKEKQDQPEEAN